MSRGKPRFGGKCPQCGTPLTTGDQCAFVCGWTPPERNDTWKIIGKEIGEAIEKADD